MIITLNRPGVCKQSGASLPIGSRAAWYRNGAVYGLTCHDRAMGASKSANDSGMTLRSFAMAAFPGYKGRKIRMHVSRGGEDLSSYWSGGSRDQHVVVRLADMTRVSIPENGSGFTRVDSVFGAAGLPLSLPMPGFVLVTHSMFCGKDVGLRVCVHPDNVAGLAPIDRPMLPSASREDYPCTDAGYEDQCREACGL